MDDKTFHPINFLRRRTHASILLKYMNESKIEGFLDAGEIEACETAMIRDLALHGAISRFSPDDRRVLLHDELGWAMTLNKFIKSGRNIFFASDQLLNALDRTEVEAVHINDFRLPFSDFYLVLGSGVKNGLAFEEDHIVSGCYISSGDETIDFRFVADRPGYHVPWFEWDPWGAAAIDCSDQNKTVGSAFDDWLDRQRTPTIVVRDKHKRLLALAVNLLCYLTAIPTREVEVSAKAPRDLVANLKSKRPALRDSARRELLRREFSMIRVLDLPAGSKDGQSEHIGGDLPCHWRKGHWRRQPYGSSRSLVRLTWIRPTIVRSDKGEPAHGHSYIIG